MSGLVRNATCSVFDNVNSSAQDVIAIENMSNEFKLVCSSLGRKWVSSEFYTSDGANKFGQLVNYVPQQPLCDTSGISYERLKCFLTVGCSRASAKVNSILRWVWTSGKSVVDDVIQNPTKLEPIKSVAAAGLLTVGAFSGIKAVEEVFKAVDNPRKHALSALGYLTLSGVSFYSGIRLDNIKL